jgi:SAM-dependent methyltransferase
MPATNATTRFSSRVEDYIRYRPGYPVEIIDLLADRCALTPEAPVADIGSGTGILSRLFLENGNTVVGVEPNAEMRAAADALLSEYSQYGSLNGTADKTNLPGRSVDFVVAGQAFHWFDRDKTREEWLRILRPGGWAVLLWNDRRTAGSDFLTGYEALLRNLGTDYQDIGHKKVQSVEALTPFFGGDVYAARFAHVQHFDLPGLIGRTASSSYTPERGTPAFAEMEKALTELFNATQKANRVSFEYDTLMFYGQMA